MKRFVLALLVSFISFFVSAATITWIGVSGSNWNYTANWSTATVPTSADDVIFNTSVIVEMDILTGGTYTINSLLITNNSTVDLQKTQSGGGDRFFQLASTSTTTPGLKIDNGCTLTIDAINTGGGTIEYSLALTGNAGVTGEIYGNLYIKGTGAGNGGAEIDLSDGAANFAALVVKSSGYIKYFINTDNTSPGAGSYLTMENGSIYEIEKNGGSFPDGTWEPNSLAKVTGTTNAGPGFNGNSYGNLEWNAVLQTSASVIGKDISFNNVDILNTGSAVLRAKGGTGATTYTMTINGNLNVAIGTILETSGNSTISGAPGIIQVKGNVINNGIIRENSSVTGNQFQLTGTSNQNISGSGSWTGDDLTFIMNNAAGATLNAPLNLPNNLALTNGKITTTAPFLLTMIAGSSYTGGSITSFVDGPMKKIGNTDFTFPVGTGGIYAPIGISGGIGALATDEFTKALPKAIK